MEKRRVILYGNSVILGTVGTSLKQTPGLEIVSITAPLPASQELGALAPDVIIFDLEAAHPDVALSLLEKRPRLLLIGIDPATDQMLLWSGEHSRALRMDDLLQAIQVLPQASVSRKLPAPDLAGVTSHIARRVKAAWLSFPRRSRVLAGALVGLFSFLVLTFALFHPGPTLPLAGTVALGHGNLRLVLAFSAGIVLGGLVLGLWLRRRR